MEHKDVSDVFAAIRTAVDWLERKIDGTWITRVFVQGTMPLKRWAPPHLARSQEIDEPFRFATALVIHIPPFRYGLTVGMWSKTGMKEDEALLRAIRPHRAPTYKELRFWDVDHARDVLFRNGPRPRVQWSERGLRDGATRDARSDGTRPVDTVEDDDYYEFRGRW